MRIAIVSGTFHPEPGGPPTYLYRLAADLVARGHRVRVATYGERSPGGDYPYPVRRVSRRQPIPARLARLTWLVARDAADADLIYANDYGIPPLLANAVARKPLVMKVVSDFAWEYGVRHGLVPPETSIEAFQQARVPRRLEAVRRLQSLYARRADAVIVPSAYLGRLVEGWGVPPERLRVIHNAVEHAPVVEEQAALRRRLGLPADARLVVTVARLVPWKGVDTLLRAQALLQAAGTRVHLAVVGDGDERPALETLAGELGLGEVVQFVGAVAQAQVQAYLAAADAFALASSYEGFSHVLLEAMAAGTPLVATCVGGNVEAVRDGINGLLVPPGSPPALAGALRRLLSDGSLRARLGAAARETAGAFSWEALLDRTEGLFREVVAARGGCA